MSKTYQITVIGGKARTTNESDRMKKNGLSPQKYFSIRLTEPQVNSGNGLRVRKQKKQYGMAIFERQHSSWFQDIQAELDTDTFNKVNSRTKNDKEIFDAQLSEYGIAGEVRYFKFEPFYITDASGKVQKRYDATLKDMVDATASIRPVFVEDGEELEVAIERERAAIANRGLFVKSEGEAADDVEADEEE